MLLIIIVVIVARRRNRPEVRKDQRSVVAFENPMYGEATKKHEQPTYGSNDQHEGLYDEPAFAGTAINTKENPMYNSNEDLTKDTSEFGQVIRALQQPIYDNDGEEGYLGVGEPIAMPTGNDQYLEAESSQPVYDSADVKFSGGVVAQPDAIYGDEDLNAMHGDDIAAGFTMNSGAHDEDEPQTGDTGYLDVGYLDVGAQGEE